MGKFVSTWIHFEFPEPLEMVRRDSLRPGDVAYSSHYGKSTVKAVHHAGTEGQTTHIIWESPNVHVRSERYDSDSTVPLVSRATPETTTLDVSPADVTATLDDFARTQQGLRRLRRWVEEHINQPTDDAWGEGYLAAVKRVQAEIEGIDRQKEAI